MKVVEVTQPGDTEQLKVGQRPTPNLTAGEVLIKVAAAGVNRADIMQRKGQYPPPSGAPDLLGLEVSGTIVNTASDVKTHKIGDEVCALLPGGGYAEYCVAAASSCLPKPKNMGLKEAAALPETFFTVWTNVFMQGLLKAGEKFLIHGGTSGIGTTAIQLARAFGASVCATAGSDKKCQACIDLGAELAINYKTSDFVKEVLDWDSKGVNLILDIISGDYVAKNLKCLAFKGRLVIIATQGGYKTEINVLPIMTKRLTVTGSTLRARSIEQKAEIAEELKLHVWPLLENDSIKPLIDSVFPLDEVRSAHKHMESGSHIGKILLEIN